MCRKPRKPAEVFVKKHRFNWPVNSDEDTGTYSSGIFVFFIRKVVSSCTRKYRTNPGFRQDDRRARDAGIGKEPQRL